jgi:hypothetical protein
MVLSSFLVRILKTYPYVHRIPEVLTIECVSAAFGNLWRPGSSIQRAAMSMLFDVALPAVVSELRQNDPQELAWLHCADCNRTFVLRELEGGSLAILFAVNGDGTFAQEQ